MKKSLAALAFAIAAATGAAPATAQSTGQWSVESTLLSGRPWNKLQVCLKDDHTWYSIEQRKGAGRWLPAGHGMLFHGAFDMLSVSADLAITGPTGMSGNVQQWVNNSLTADNQSNLFATSKWTFVSATCASAF
jgi:hypothetical protein